MLGRKKSERRSEEVLQVIAMATLAQGSCHSQAARSPLSVRVCGTWKRVVSRLLPLFKRRTEEVGALLPELYLDGLSLGDFELALRGLLGDGAPLSPSSILRLKTEWQQQYAITGYRGIGCCSQRFGSSPAVRR